MKKVDFYGKMTNKDRIRIRVTISERLIFFGCRVHSSKLPIVRGRPFYAQYRHAGSARHRLGHREQMRAKPGGSKGRLRRGFRSGSHGVAMGPTMGAAEHPVTTAALRAGRRHQFLVQGRAHFLITKTFEPPNAPPPPKKFEIEATLFFGGAWPILSVIRSAPKNRTKLCFWWWGCL